MPIAHELSRSLNRAREKLITDTFAVTVLAGGVLVFGNMLRNVFLGGAMSFTYPVLYGFVLLCYVFRRRIGAEFIAWMLVAAFFCAGALGLLFYGLASNSIAVILTCMVTATLFFGLRGGLWIIALTLLCMTAAAVGYVTKGWPLRIDMLQFMTSPVAWIAALLSFASMSGLLLYLVWRMIEQQQAMLADQNRIALHDALTGLPNRRLLEDRLGHAFAASKRSGKQGALLFIDLDHFKTLNDTLGHNIGDLLLCEVAKRASACVRKSDTVSRFGGDEFVVLLENVDPTVEPAAIHAGKVAEKILNSILQPYVLERHRHQISASIGIALFPEDENSLEDLMRHADIAMYQSKQAGRNTIRFFDPSMQDVIESRTRIEKWLDTALSDNQFALHYQMQICDDGRIVGAEVLLRWTHPERGPIPPGEFIPVAEETGQIAQIGQWALEDACRRIKSWENHPLLGQLQLAVNVSGRQVQQANFVEQVDAVVKRHAIDPRRLKLEITESLMQGNMDDIIDKMQRLRALGVGFSMDDFGTGYSSLSRLKKLPIDQLKIDRSFVNDIVRDSEDVAIVQTIIAMARALEMEVIAEGIETEEQRAYLVRLGCLHFQGYLFGRPVSADQFEKQILEHSAKSNASGPAG